MFTSDCICEAFACISMQKHRSMSHDEPKWQLSWTMRGIHFNASVTRFIRADCLTKFDGNLITAEWPIVSVARWAVQFLRLIKCRWTRSVRILCSLRIPRNCANDVVDIEMKSMRKPQEIREFLLPMLTPHWLLWRFKKWQFTILSPLTTRRKHSGTRSNATARTFYEPPSIKQRIILTIRIRKHLICSVSAINKHGKLWHLKWHVFYELPLNVRVAFPFESRHFASDSIRPTTWLIVTVAHSRLRHQKTPFWLIAHHFVEYIFINRK